MKNSVLIFICLPALFIGSYPLAAQPAQPGLGATIQLEPTKQLRKGVDAWPLISRASTAPAQRINNALTRLNLRVQESAAECEAESKDVSGGWSRKITVTMTGPRYLSMVARDDMFCGGAHPDSDTLAMVFDLNTGAPVNWLTLIAKSANASSYSDSIADGTKVGALVVPALLQMSKAKADTECKDAFQEPQSYQLWPDAKAGKLMAEPFDLPHAVVACAEDLALTPDQARKLGFDESILTAFETAHRK